MCYHASVPDKTNVSKMFKDMIMDFDYRGFYHVSGFSHPDLPVVTSLEEGKVMTAMWGFLPFFVKDKEKAKETMRMTLNATCEKLFTTPMYKAAAPKQRCLIAVTGFFEWKWLDEKGKEKVPYFIHVPGQDAFTFGGIYNDWTDPDTGEIIKTCSIVTTPANTLMAEIHNNKKRMPFILSEEQWPLWLDTTTPEEAVQDLMKPYPEGLLAAHEISRNITKRGFDTNVPEIQEPVNNTPPALF